MADRPIKCEICGGRAMPQQELVVDQGGNRRIHYDCENGHRFHVPFGILHPGDAEILRETRFSACDCPPANSN